MTDIVEVAKNYLARTPADSSASPIIVDLIREVESLRRQWCDGVSKLLEQIKENADIVRAANAKIDDLQRVRGK